MALKSDKFSESDFTNLEYRKKPLTEIVLKYNEADGKIATDFSKKQNTSKVSVKVIAGIGLATIKSHDYYYNFRNYDGNGLSYRIGFEIEAKLPFNNNKWALFADPNFNFLKDDGNTKLFTVETEYNYLQLPFGLRHYMFLNTSSKIFLNGGFALHIPTASTITYIASNNSKVSIDLEKSTTVFTGIGYEKNKISAELRYNFRYTISNNPIYTVQHSLASLVFGYKF